MPITIIENIDHTTMSYPRKYSVDSHYEVRGWSKLEQFQERTPRRKWRGRASSPNLDHVYQFMLAECIIWRSIHRGDNCIIHIGYITLLRWPWKKSRMIGSIWKKFIVEETNKLKKMDIVKSLEFNVLVDMYLHFQHMTTPWALVAAYFPLIVPQTWGISPMICCRTHWMHMAKTKSCVMEVSYVLEMGRSSKYSILVVGSVFLKEMIPSSLRTIEQ